MQPVSFKRHKFPPDVIRLAVWLYFRFTLSFRDVEEILCEALAELQDPAANGLVAGLEDEDRLPKAGRPFCAITLMALLQWTFWLFRR